MLIVMRFRSLEKEIWSVEKTVKWFLRISNVRSMQVVDAVTTNLVTNRENRRFMQLREMNLVAS